MGHRGPSFATSKRYPGLTPLYGPSVHARGEYGRSGRRTCNPLPLFVLCSASALSIRIHYREIRFSTIPDAPGTVRSRCPDHGSCLGPALWTTEGRGECNLLLRSSCSVRPRDRVEARESTERYTSVFYLLDTRRDRREIIMRGPGLPRETPYLRVHDRRLI